MEKIDEIKELILSLDSDLTKLLESSGDVVEVGNTLLALNLIKRDLSIIYDSLER